MATKPKNWEKLSIDQVRRLQKKMPNKRKDFEAGYVELDPPDPAEGAYSDDEQRANKKNKSSTSEAATFVQWLFHSYDGHNGHIRKLKKDLLASPDRPKEEDYFTVYAWLKKQKADLFILEACELAHQIFDQALREPEPSSFSSSSSSSSSTKSMNNPTLIDTKHSVLATTKQDSVTKQKDSVTKKQDSASKKKESASTGKPDIYTTQSFVVPDSLLKTNHEWISTFLISDFITVAQDVAKKTFTDFRTWLTALSLEPQDWNLSSETKSDGRHHVMLRFKNYNLYCDQTSQPAHVYRFEIQDVKEWSLERYKQLLIETGATFFHSSSDTGIQWTPTPVSRKFVAEWAKYTKSKFPPTGREQPVIRFEDVAIPFVVDLSSDWSKDANYKTNLLKPNQKTIKGFARYGVSNKQMEKLSEALTKMGLKIVRIL